VLAQAEDDSVPLLERLRYLCISSNLDEFFEVRIASLLANASRARISIRPNCAPRWSAPAPNATAS
jgi:polyphosphate kinase